MLVVVPLLTVVIILATVWRWGGVRTARLAGDADVHRALASEHPAWRATEVVRSLDARAALACAPPDPTVAVVFAQGDRLTTRLLQAGDVARVEGEAVHAGEEASRGAGGPVETLGDAPARRDGAVPGRVRLHDVGCPDVALTLPREQWDAWIPRLQRLVGVAALLALSAAASPAGARALALGVVATHRAPCDDRYRASWSPDAPRPGTLFALQLTSTLPGMPPGARVGNEPLHFRSADDSLPVERAATWAALAAVPIDAERSIALRIACPDGSGDSATVRIPLASASYPLERLRVAPRFSAPPDSALSARMAREAERAAEVSRISHETPRLWRQPFARPRESRVTSAFGHGRVFNGSVTSRHMGTDYAGATGAPVYAANRGVVRLVDAFYLGGNVVYLDHGEGLVTAYLHLSKHLVAEGDTVERGARIGLVGATGRVTGPHLHWIARYGRVSVDPASLLRVTSAGERRAAPGSR